MVCKFRACIFEENYQCQLPEIAVDENGYCILAKHVECEYLDPNPEHVKKLEEYLESFKLPGGGNMLEKYRERRKAMEEALKQK